MGSLCDKCTKKKQDTFLNAENPSPDAKEAKEPAVREVEIDFKSYSSSFDSFFKKIESYNVLGSFGINEFVSLMNKIQVQIAQEIVPKIETDENHPHEIELSRSSHDEMDRMEFLLFFEAEIMKNPKVVAKVYNRSDEGELILKDYITEIIDALVFATIDLFKKKNPGVKVKKGSIKTVKKINLKSIPLLYCSSSNRGKVNFFFNLFAKDGIFHKNEELLDFLFYLFIVPSTISFRAVKNISMRYANKFKTVSDEEYMNKMDAFEIEDIYRLREIFINDFFGEKESLTKQEFDTKFETEEFGWIFSAAGIRSYLEKNNDVKEKIEV